MLHYDYIIIGQGIAGSMLAWFLLKSGRRVLVVDEFNRQSASQVASGMINPVTGKRLVKSWKADELLPFAKTAYRELESELHIDIFSEKTICRIFSNKEDSVFFRQKTEMGELPEYVKPLNEIPSCFNDTGLGGVEISASFQLDYSSLLSALRKYFREREILADEKFVADCLDMKDGTVAYKGAGALKIIFCEGSQALENPYFNWLPFNLAKGEVLTVKMEGFPEDKVWHKSVFILPLGRKLFKIGATYQWEFKDGYPSGEGREDLESRLRSAVNLRFEIMGHDAAIRPTVVDRRPLVGMHPVYNQLGVFNGMGTKGALLAPFFAQQFAKYLNDGLPLDSEVNISRFSKEPFYPVRL